MGKIKKLILLIIFLFPLPALTAGAGFVPSTGIWFSTSTFVPHQAVRVYSVVINTDYYLLDGTVGFYDNNELIDSIDFKGLPKESAKEIKVFWEPTEGEHTIGAKFIKAVVTDEKGVRQELNSQDINSFTGAPLVVGGGSQIVPSVALDSATVSSPVVSSAAVAVGGAQVVVKKEGANLVLVGRSATPSPDAPPQTITNIAASADQLFQKNRDIIAKAGTVANTITTTAGKIEKVYGEARSVVERGQSYYTRGQMYWNTVAPYAQKAKQVWLVVSNNNEPKRIVIIAVVVLVLWFLVKRSWRRRRYYYDN